MSDKPEPTTKTLQVPARVGDMLAAIFGDNTPAAQEEEEEEKETRGTPMAQAVFLHDLFARYNAPRPAKLVPGDIVQFKPGMGFIKDEMREGLVMMVWRNLSGVSPGDEAFAAKWVAKLAGGASSCVDMDVVHLCDDGHCLVHMGVDSRELELRTISGEAEEAVTPPDPAAALAQDELVA